MTLSMTDSEDPGAPTYDLSESERIVASVVDDNGIPFLCQVEGDEDSRPTDIDVGANQGAS